MRVLVTGGTGYVGSHTALALLQAGHAVTLLDNGHNSDPSVAERVGAIAGHEAPLVQADIRDQGALARVLADGDFDAVMHFAALKAVGESVERPLAYYDVNVGGTARLCRAMAEAGVNRLIFSSSATVYGDPERVPLTEDAPTGRATNPYGHTKSMAERILADQCHAEPDWAVGVLRYFNPVGAHESALIGERPQGEPANLVPYVTQVAAGEREVLTVFGDDYPTRDGTGVRDYIHVMDLAEGHVRALERIARQPGWQVWNLGRGEGHSVLEVIRTFETVTGRRVPYRVAGRRPGDIAACWADPGRAQRELGWRAERDLATMLQDAWRWQVSSTPG